MKNKLKFSRYNYLVELEEDGYWGLYNFYRRNKLILSPLEKALFDGILETPDTPLCKKWKRQGFIVDYDEALSYRSLYYTQLFDTREMGLTICTTMACNFRCPYCYENRGTGAMDEKTQDAIISMIKDYFEEYKPQRLSVCWYGGEPLLYPQVVESLSERMVKLSKEYDVTYDSSMVTNGYLLNQDIVDMLSRYNCKYIQVTLDGMKETNDKTRILANGEGSFDRIISNIRSIRADFEIHIRSNITRENYKEFGELSSFINEIKEETGNDIQVYPGHTYAFGDNGENVKATVMGNKEFHDLMDKYFTYNAKDRTRGKEDMQLLPCGMTRLYTLVVDESGDLYKCWDYVGIKDYRIGNLNDGIDIFTSSLATPGGSYIMGYDPIDDVECRDCILLPRCKGGCFLTQDALGKEWDCIKYTTKEQLERLVKSIFANEDGA